MSCVYGVLIGAAFSALVFSFAWGGSLFGAGESPSLFVAVMFGFLLSQLGLDARAHLKTVGRVWSARLALVVTAVGAALLAYSIWSGVRGGVGAAWVADKEFVTLVVGGGLFGIVVLSGALRGMRRLAGRVMFWPAAAAALWFAGEWLVNLGPLMDRWDDPRSMIAMWCVMGTGAFCLFGVLAVMDWRITGRGSHEYLAKDKAA